MNFHTSSNIATMVRSIMKKHGKTSIWNNKYRTSRSIKCYVGADDSKLIADIRRAMTTLGADYSIRNTISGLWGSDALIVNIPFSQAERPSKKAMAPARSFGESTWAKKVKAKVGRGVEVSLGINPAKFVKKAPKVVLTPAEIGVLHLAKEILAKVNEDTYPGSNKALVALRRFV